MTAAVLKGVSAHDRPLRPISIFPRPLGALSHNNNRGAVLVPSDFHMEER
jgi:hypothetical protein